MIVSDVGDTLRAKSGGAGAEIVTGTVTEWLSVPEVPVRVSVALPAAAVVAAVIVTFCAIPGVRVSVAGCAITPASSPVIATVTIPVNPLAATSSTLICCVAPPGTSVRLDGIKPRAKSAATVGLDPPPQDIKTRHRRRLTLTPNAFEKRPISTLTLALQRFTFAVLPSAR
jgi:hypothetical protein